MKAKKIVLSCKVNYDVIREARTFLFQNVYLLYFYTAIFYVALFE